MTNPYLKRMAERSPLSHGLESEKRLAKLLKARPMPASGAMKGAKGDMSLNLPNYKFKIESKSTIHKTMTLELGWLVKITEEATAIGSMPAITLSFVTSEGKPHPKGDWVAVPTWVFNTLMERVG